ncbi:hypothetical protein HMPREF2976_11775 [Corynebacterium sp. HMSC077D10]|uniref:ATP-binding protein n=1 Tax=unclassified Corynebacterium TaxID=2624378 RepID=UPI0007975D12|nr:MULTISPECIES: ATP-binding protein [unclassified Corynebacterium]KXB52480.1 divergent AAA domain protein [Corynebacterium sp. DNF00584]OFL79388.1 hypothetical protein HMPREF2748_10290 [Corynebacterium sp. HMSC077B05]OFN43210.1 hypothetical protein HMPREF2559_10700 [Corynebacterium sp. HMSC072G08]OFP18455.1 hypothetical protein HMPREF2998_12230 [Corynebacterium sp. HMSC065A05]OFP65750.1 hypothetical protein HMPREF2976_11775 [Corynebacterium sp. HMSC077D10]
MDFEAVVDVLEHHDSDNQRIEVKRTASSLGKSVWDSISAFANTDGGVVVLGVNETPEGFVPAEDFSPQKIRDELLSGLNEKSSAGTKVTPVPEYQISTETWRDHPVIMVGIEPMRFHPQHQRNMPCYVTAKGLKNGTFKRVGDADKRMSAYEIYQWQSRFIPDDSDAAIVNGAALEDLDLEAAAAMVETLRVHNSRVVEGAEDLTDVLARLNVLSSGVPTLAGVLTFGHYPQQFFPQLFIDVTSHPGVAKGASDDGTRFRSREMCDGPIPLAIQSAVDAVMKEMRVRYVERDAQVDREPEIPEMVVRESITNAVMHRDYSPIVQGRQIAVDIFADRVEIRNPGGLWGDRTVDNIRDNSSMSRNRRLSSLLSRTPAARGSGTVSENQGSGVPRMFQAMTKSGLPGPEFIDRGGEFVVVLSRFGLMDDAIARWVDSVAPHAERALQVALVFARDLGAVTPHMLREHLGLDSDDARACLERGVRDGVLDAATDERFVLSTSSLGLDSEQEKILALLADKGTLSSHEVAEGIGLSLSRVRPRLSGLVDVGLIEATAPLTSRNRKYHLA